MVFTYTPELQAYMRAKGRNCILVELVEVSTSDLEVNELHVRFADPKTREIFLNKRRYRSVPTELGEVLLPPYPLEFADTVTFGLKSFLFIKYISHKGIKI